MTLIFINRERTKMYNCIICGGLCPSFGAGDDGINLNFPYCDNHKKFMIKEINEYRTNIK